MVLVMIYFCWSLSVTLNRNVNGIVAFRRGVTVGGDVG